MVLWCWFGVFVFRCLVTRCCVLVWYFVVSGLLWFVFCAFFVRFIDFVFMLVGGLLVVACCDLLVCFVGFALLVLSF